jgi:hypothetical protein
MESTAAISRVLTLAGVVSLLLATSCKAQADKEGRLRAYMESPPFVAPMGYEDITNPQIGYTHSPGGIEGGQFLLVKENDFRSANESSPKPIDFRKISFYDSSQPALAPGFRPEAATCKYGLRKPGQWNCLIFRGTEDAQKYFKSVDRSPVPYVVCLDCKPRAVPMLSRICPGVYTSSLDRSSDWKDPTIPGPVFTKGMCTFALPWWRTDSGIKLGIKKFGDYIE